MSMIEAFIKNLNKASISLLENMEIKWFAANHPNAALKNIILCSIIDEKLKRYEEEY